MELLPFSVTSVRKLIGKGRIVVTRPGVPYGKIGVHHPRARASSGALYQLTQRRPIP